MTELYRFFDGSPYTENQFAEFMSRIIKKDGIIMGQGNELVVIQSTPPAMTVSASTGEVFIQGVFYQNTAAKEMTIEAADTALNRIDRIVLRLSFSGNTIGLAVLKGTAAVSPTAPALTRTVDSYELSLARVLVSASVTTITTADITDERVTEYCGLSACNLGAIHVGDDASLDMAGVQIHSLLDPTSSQDAATKAYADTKATLASPAFTGNPTAPKQAAGNNSARLATTSFVQQELGTWSNWSPTLTWTGTPATAVTTIARKLTVGNNTDIQIHITYTASATTTGLEISGLPSMGYPICFYKFYPNVGSANSGELVIKGSYEKDGSSCNVPLSSYQKYYSGGTLYAEPMAYINRDGAAIVYPVAQFSGFPLVGTVPLSVAFTDLSTGSPSTWYWTFFDGPTQTSSPLQNPTYEFKNVGTHTVSLKVNLNLPGYDEEQKFGYITANPPASGYGAGTVYAGYTIGGGAGYPTFSEVNTGYTTHVITSTADFAAHMVGGASQASTGHIVYIPPGLTIDLTGTAYDTITIPGGVIVASNRGYAGSLGALIKCTSDPDAINAMLDIGGNGVRITGLRIQGHDHHYSASLDKASSTATNASAGIRCTSHTDLVVDNCEIYDWSWAGITLTTSTATIRYNNFHHCASWVPSHDSWYGYGISLYNGTTVIEGNYFNYGRHAVILEGGAAEYGTIRFNIIGHDFNNPSVDAHSNGSSTVGNGSGVTYAVYNNTVSSHDSAFWVLYGTPSSGATIYSNDFPNGTPGVWRMNGPTNITMTDNRVGGTVRATGPYYGE